MIRATGPNAATPTHPPRCSGAVVCWLVALACASGCASSPPAVPPTIVGTGQGPVNIAIGKLAVQELSGIAWLGGTRYLAVGDNGANLLWDLDVAIDPANGRIGAAAATGSVAIGGLAADGEGLVWIPERGTVVVSDEATSAIREFRLSDGTQVGALPVPALYLAPNLRSNLGLESLGAHGGMVWTVNEEALVADGPISTTTSGAGVRVQRFAADRSPAGQWAYRVDPISAMNPFTTLERSGVVDVLPIAVGAALILERELGGAVVPDFRSRIYYVETGGATDVSSFASLAGGDFTPLAKTLLWQGDFALQNFEGMTFGPRLDDGCRSLLLVSDGNPGGSQGTTSLVALRICGLPACSADIDGSGAVEGGDLAVLLGAWGSPNLTADLDGDGIVAGGDLAMLLGAWGGCG
jgi:hypothetical protein